MWHLYLDESGDLGFNFTNKKPSNFLTITILVFENSQSNRALFNVVRKTIRRKLNPKGKRRRVVSELKGYFTSFAVKKYFYEQLNKVPFEIFSVSIDKRQLSDKLTDEKHHVYNYVVRLTLDAIPFEKAQNRVRLVIDKSKNKRQIEEFNNIVINQLLGRLAPDIPIDIIHNSSVNDYVLQAVDMFSWGIFRKYERANKTWYDIFESHMKYDRRFPE